jgi:hypothetical protein
MVRVELVVVALVAEPRWRICADAAVVMNSAAKNAHNNNRVEVFIALRFYGYNKKLLTGGLGRRWDG